jgi:hypothetical protein
VEDAVSKLLGINLQTQPIGGFPTAPSTAENLETAPLTKITTVDSVAPIIEPWAETENFGFEADALFPTVEDPFVLDASSVEAEVPEDDADDTLLSLSVEEPIAPEAPSVVTDALEDDADDTLLSLSVEEPIAPEVPPSVVTDALEDDADDTLLSLSVEEPIAQEAPSVVTGALEDDADDAILLPPTVEEPQVTEMFELATDDIAQLLQAEALTEDTAAFSEPMVSEEESASDVVEPTQDVPVTDSKTATALEGGTVRLSPEDILAAMTSSVPIAKATETAASNEQDVPIVQKDDGSTKAEPNEPAPVSESSSVGKPKEAVMPLGIAEPTNNEASKIKVRMGPVLIEQLTIEEVAAMAEEGKLEEHHLVARQFSENWIEAPKVPVLRPIYERLRRNRQPNVAVPPTSTASAPKGGLFGRLFGRN